MQGKGIWKFRYQGVNLPLVTLGTIMEHHGGRVTKEDESEATIDDMVGSKSGGSVDLESSGPDGDENPEMILDLLQSNTEDDVAEEKQNEVLQNEKTTDVQTFLRLPQC